MSLVQVAGSMWHGCVRGPSGVRNKESESPVPTSTGHWAPLGDISPSAVGVFQGVKVNAFAGML